MILNRAAVKYVEAVRELVRLNALTPTEEYAVERAATIKAQAAKVAELYRTLRGSDLGAANRELKRAK